MKTIFDKTRNSIFQTQFRKKTPWKGFQAFVIFCTIASQSLYVLSSHPLFLAHPAGRGVAPDWSMNFCSSSVRIFCPKHDYNCSQTDNHYKSIYGPVSDEYSSCRVFLCKDHWITFNFRTLYLYSMTYGKKNYFL